ncbi:MAG: cob(I)yrinic acid a,c-diamide adenosyltransferase [Microgenomates group bacterium]
MTIVTKKGDGGYTYLYNGKKLSKSDDLTDTIGTIDELQAFIGLVYNKIKKKKTKKILTEIEKDLYQIMAYLSAAKINLKPVEKRVFEFEEIIKNFEKNNPKITKFVLPGKNEASSWFHILRTITRRAERKVVKLFKTKKNYPDDSLIIAYFNRLSDLFFVFSLV